MSELDLTYQFISKFGELERELQRLRLESPPAGGADAEAVRALTRERDALKDQLAAARRQAEDDARRLVEEQERARSGRAELQAQLEALRKAPPPPPPPPSADAQEMSRLRERLVDCDHRLGELVQQLVVAEHQLTEARADIRKLRDENYQLRKQLHDGQSRQHGGLR